MKEAQELLEDKRAAAQTSGETRLEAEKEMGRLRCGYGPHVLIEFLANQSA